MESRSLELPGCDGIKLHALEWSREGVPLVLVHGFGNDAHVWDEIAPALAPYYRTLAITLRGHGDSGRTGAEGQDGETLVRDLETALDALGFERLVLVGHSLGGRICTQLAGRQPDRLAGLVLVDSAPRMDRRGIGRIREETREQRERPDPSFASEEDYLAVLERQYPATRTATLRRLAHHWLRPRDDGRYELKLDLRPPRPRQSEARPSAEAASAPRDPNERLWNALRRTACPTLVVRGAASDVLSAEVADRMVDEVLPDGRLAVVPRAGHSVMLDNPEGFTQVLTDFVLG